MKSPLKLPSHKERQSILNERRNLKMARSAHAYVRGSTAKFYEWLDTPDGRKLPQGPAIWICGDCHVGNLGPVANAEGKIALQIRDFDQTVTGNPAHDLIRLGLSLATAARGSDLPGVTTAQMLEQMMEGYEHAFTRRGEKQDLEKDQPLSVQEAMQQALKRRWKHLARERIKDTTPVIPLGKRFWPLEKREKKAIAETFERKDVRQLATLLRSRDGKAEVRLLDAAYWMKGCSSLGNLRYAILLEVEKELCLMDIKEAMAAIAPGYTKTTMPRDNAARIVEGATHLSPYLGERMLPLEFLGHSVFLRELLPQDLKIEMEHITRIEAVKAARYLSMVVGKAHARQMNEATRRKWKKELSRNRSKSLDVPSWLWRSIVELLSTHEAAYLEHCRRYAMRAD